MSSNTVNQRVNFASTKNPLEYPDFLEVQLKSFQDFLQLDTPPDKRKNEGLYKVFAENFPIADTRNNFVLEFLDYYIDPVSYTHLTEQQTYVVTSFTLIQQLADHFNTSYNRLLVFTQTEDFIALQRRPRICAA